MSYNSKIEWYDTTWNPVCGCSKISDGCKFCYAERMAFRQANMEIKRSDENFDGNPPVPFMKGKYYDVVNLATRKWNGSITCDESALDKPLHWLRPRKIFVCSMSDLFHPKVPFEFIDKVFNRMVCKAPQHLYQVLTKRPERMLEYLSQTERDWRLMWSGMYNFPFKNIWLGVTVEHPDYKHRIDTLRQIPAAVRFLSIEPCLADMGELNLEGIHQVIVGGESGPGARLCKLEWVRSVANQCKSANVKLFVKQLHLDGKAKAIKDVNQFPKDLRIREYPNVSWQK